MLDRIEEKCYNLFISEKEVAEMPIIRIGVPFGIGAERTRELRADVRQVLFTGFGIAQGETTVEFFPQSFPERLLIKCESNSPAPFQGYPQSGPFKGGKMADLAAHIIGKRVEDMLKMRVECQVLPIDPDLGKAGLYLTP